MVLTVCAESCNTPSNAFPKCQKIPVSAISTKFTNETLHRSKVDEESIFALTLFTLDRKYCKKSGRVLEQPLGLLGLTPEIWPTG